MTVAAAPPPFRPPRHFATAADWHLALGGVPLDRIIFDPWPGTATESDVLLLAERDKRLCELIDGTLVQKPAGYWEALIATRLSTRLTVHSDYHGLGDVSGAGYDAADGVDRPRPTAGRSVRRGRPPANDPRPSPHARARLGG